MRQRFDVTENLEKFCKILKTKQALSLLQPLAGASKATDWRSVAEKCQEHFGFRERMRRRHSTAQNGTGCPSCPALPPETWDFRPFGSRPAQADPQMHIEPLGSSGNQQSSLSYHHCIVWLVAHLCQQTNSGSAVTCWRSAVRPPRRLKFRTCWWECTMM